MVGGHWLQLAGLGRWFPHDAGFLAVMLAGKARVKKGLHFLQDGTIAAMPFAPSSVLVPSK